MHTALYVLQAAVTTIATVVALVAILALAVEFESATRADENR